MAKIGFISLGCAKNQVDCERMMYRVQEAGHTVCAEVAGCDVVVINTCGFIDSAKSEAIDYILKAAAMKEAGLVGKILVTGCLSQRYQQDILKEMDDCAKRGDLRAFTECDTAFHRAIIDATGNQVLLRLWEQCNMRNWLIVPALTNAESLLQLQCGHQHICQAICAKDVKEATSTLEDHLTGLMDGFIRGIQP